MKLRKRLGSIALCMAMLLSLLPATALAAPPTGLWVAGTQITGEGYWLNDNGGITATGASESNYNVKYDGSGTLTLKGASINRYHSFDVSSGTNSAAIYAAGDLNLVLEETSTVGGDAANGIYTTGSLTISGTGTANITIAAEGGCGIFASSSLTAQSGSITVAATGSNSCGISAASVTVNGGTVNAQGYVIGLLSQSTISVSTGNLTGKGGVGVFSITTLSVSGGTVVGTSEESVDDGYSFGIYTLKSLTITGGSVTGTGVEAGVVAAEDINISGSSILTATGTGTTGNSYGVAVQGDVTVAGTPDVTATGYTAGMVLVENKLFTLNGSVFSLSGTTVKVEAGQATQGLTSVAPPADDGVNTEAELIAAIEQGGEIKLTGNIELTKVLIIDNSVDLDLNGHTIRQTGSTTMNWCNWYDCPDDVCKWNTGSDPHQETERKEAIHVVGGQSDTVAVNIRDTSTDQTGAVIAGDGAGFAVTIYGDNLDLQIYGGTFSGGSGYCVYNGYRWSQSWITLHGGTYLNGVQVNTIYNGTFRNESGSGTQYVGAYDIYDGICEAGTEAQMTEFYGGTFNGAAECFGIVAGGIFNGYLHLSRGVTSVSGCTINHSLEWSNSTMPTFTNVKFGENVKLWNDGYEIVNGQIQAIPKYTVLVTTADSDMGTVTVSGSVKNPGSAMGITPTTPANGGRQWADAYRNATVNITSATAEAKDGYKFVGWFDNADGTGTAISTNAMLTYQSDENGLQSDLSFYAVFESDASYGDKVATANIWLGDYDKTSEFTINSIGDMQSFTIAVNYLGKNFSGKTVKLADDLTYTDADSFTPIGNSGIAFQGIFDGQNHSISGLRYSTTNQSSAYVGLFGNVNGAEIKNLTLSGVNFSGGWMTGAFAGHADNTAFTNCKLTGNSSLADAYFLGGIFGPRRCLQHCQRLHRGKQHHRRLLEDRRRVGLHLRRNRDRYKD